MPTVGILNAKGGVGKSMTTMWLAAAAVYSDKITMPVNIVDADVNQGDLSIWYEDAVSEHNEDPNKPYLDMQLHSGNHAQILRKLRVLPKDQFTIVDGPPNDHSMISEVARLSDLVLVPTPGSPGEIENVINTTDMLKAEKVPYQIMFTRWQKSANIIPNTRAVFDEMNEPSLWPPIAQSTYLQSAKGTWPRNHFNDLRGHDSLLNQVLELLNG